MRSVREGERKNEQKKLRREYYRGVTARKNAEMNERESCEQKSHRFYSNEIFCFPFFRVVYKWET